MKIMSYMSIFTFLEKSICFQINVLFITEENEMKKSITGFGE